MAEIRILHAQETQAFACRVAAALAAAGHSVIRADAGEPARGRGASEILVVVWSAGMLRNESAIAEARAALAGRRLVPVAIGRIEPPQSFAHLPPIDLAGWDGDTEDARWRFVGEEIELALRHKAAGPDLYFDEPEADPAPDREEETRAFLFPVKALAIGAAGVAVAALATVLIASVGVRAPGDEAQTRVAMVDRATPRQGEPEIPPAPDLPAASPPAEEGAQPRPYADAIDPVTDRLDPPSGAPAGEAAEIETDSGADAPAGAAGEPLALDAAPVLEGDAQSARAPLVIDAPPQSEADGTGMQDDEIRLAAAENEPLLIDGAPAEAASEESASDAGPIAADAEANANAEPESEGETAEAGEPPVPALPARPVDDFLGVVFRDCLDCPDMVEIPSGAFRFGAGESDPNRQPAELPSRVEIMDRFAIARREVTLGQWNACAAEGACAPFIPTDGFGGKARPVVNVAYADAERYAAWLTAKTGHVYRLPSEAEWEYAARGGVDAPYAAGAAPGRANYAGALHAEGDETVSLLMATPTGSFPANVFGLYDAAGNVWEWTADCWRPSHDPAASADCSARVVKGGAYNSPPEQLRPAHRAARPASARDAALGFRVARDMR